MSSPELVRLIESQRRAAQAAGKAMNDMRPAVLSLTRAFGRMSMRVRGVTPLMSRYTEGERELRRDRQRQAVRPKVVRRTCAICEGHGSIWVNWHPTPVMCGHCDGTGSSV